MKPPRFKYLAARSAEEAVGHLERYSGSARLLAGGQSLIPLLNLRMARPDALIDLATCPELAYIRTESNWLAIGPMTRQSEAEQAEAVRRSCPLLAKALPFLGSPTIRNRGTIGGTLAHADRVAELPGVAVALGAEFVAQGPGGRRTIKAEDFFVADLTNALNPDEMLREIRFPVADDKDASAFVEANNRHHDLATVGVAVSLSMARGEPRAARLVAIGVGPVPTRMRRAESRLLEGRLGERDVEEAAELAFDEVDPQGDFHASADYRRRVLRNLVKRALQTATAGA